MFAVKKAMRGYYALLFSHHLQDVLYPQLGIVLLVLRKSTRVEQSNRIKQNRIQ